MRRRRPRPAAPPDPAIPEAAAGLRRPPRGEGPAGRPEPARKAGGEAPQRGGAPLPHRPHAPRRRLAAPELRAAAAGQRALRHPHRPAHPDRGLLGAGRGPGHRRLFRRAAPGRPLGGALRLPGRAHPGLRGLRLGDVGVRARHRAGRPPGGLGADAAARRLLHGGHGHGHRELDQRTLHQPDPRPGDGLLHDHQLPRGRARAVPPAAGGPGRIPALLRRVDHLFAGAGAGAAHPGERAGPEQAPAPSLPRPLPTPPRSASSRRWRPGR